MKRVIGVALGNGGRAIGAMRCDTKDGRESASFE